MTFDVSNLNILMKQGQKKQNLKDFASKDLSLEYLDYGAFALFKNQAHLTLKKEFAEQGVKNFWKAHISINPEDLNKAWSIIYPILEQQAASSPISFKVLDSLKNLDDLSDARERLYHAKTYPKFLKQIAKNEDEVESFYRFAEGMQIQCIYLLSTKITIAVYCKQ